MPERSVFEGYGEKYEHGLHHFVLLKDSLCTYLHHVHTDNFLELKYAALLNDSEKQLQSAFLKRPPARQGMHELG